GAADRTRRGGGRGDRPGSGRRHQARRLREAGAAGRPAGLRRRRAGDPSVGQLVPTIRGREGPASDQTGRHRQTLRSGRPGRPVKWRWTREEEFLCSSTRAPWHMEIADAVTSDGWIVGRKMLTLHDSGAYARFSPYGLTKHSFHHTGAYTIPNLSFDGYVVFTNRVPTTAMRGFGVTSVSFATETHMSRVADEPRLDPSH